MNQELSIKLLGPPAAYCGEEPVRDFVSVKAQALLYYLAATGEEHRRDAIAALLWSDIPEGFLLDAAFGPRLLLISPSVPMIKQSIPFPPMRRSSPGTSAIPR